MKNLLLISFFFVLKYDVKPTVNDMSPSVVIPPVTSSAVHQHQHQHQHHPQQFSPTINAQPSIGSHPGAMNSHHSSPYYNSNLLRTFNPQQSMNSIDRNSWFINYQNYMAQVNGGWIHPYENYHHVSPINGIKGLKLK